MRNVTLREAKRTLRQWFAARPVSYLMRIVDECRAGNFGYSEPCYCVRGLMDGGYIENDSREALLAEVALGNLSDLPWNYAMVDDAVLHEEAEDQLARVRTLPIVLAEIRRRNRIERLVQSVEVADGITA